MIGHDTDPTPAHGTHRLELRRCQWSALHRSDPDSALFECDPGYVGHECPTCAARIARSVIQGYNHLIGRGYSPDAAARIVAR